MKIIISIILTFLLQSCALAVTELQVTVCPSGCTYTSLNGAFVGEEQNLITGGFWLNIHIIGSAWSGAPDTTSIETTGYTTDATHYILVDTDTINKASGVYDSTKYALSCTGECFDIETSNVKVNGIQIYSTINNSSQDFSSALGVDTNDAGNIIGIYVSHCVIVLNQTATVPDEVAAVDLEGTGTTGWIYDNVIYAAAIDGTTAEGFNDNFDVFNLYAYNNTVYGFYHNFYLGVGNVTLVNNIANDSTTDYTITINGSLNSFNHSNNISQDATSPDASFQSKTVSFVSAGTNFQLASGDTSAKSKGVTSPAALLFSDDVAGTLRAAIWDIGAFRFGTPPSVSLNSYNMKWYNVSQY